MLHRDRLETRCHVKTKLLQSQKFPTCPCRSVLRSIKAHVRANTAPEDVKKERNWHPHLARAAVPLSRKLKKKYQVNHDWDSPEEEKESGLHSWKRQAKCCSTRSLSWVSPISSTTFKKDLRERNQKKRKRLWDVLWACFCERYQCMKSKPRLSNSHLRAWSRVFPVKSKNFRYSSPTAWLKSLLNRNNNTFCVSVITTLSLRNRSITISSTPGLFS